MTGRRRSASLPGSFSPRARAALDVVLHLVFVPAARLGSAVPLAAEDRREATTRVEPTGVGAGNPGGDRRGTGRAVL